MAARFSVENKVFSKYLDVAENMFLYFYSKNTLILEMF